MSIILYIYIYCIYACYIYNFTIYIYIHNTSLQVARSNIQVPICLPHMRDGQEKELFYFCS